MFIPPKQARRQTKLWCADDQQAFKQAELLGLNC